MEIHAYRTWPVLGTDTLDDSSLQIFKVIVNLDLFFQNSSPDSARICPNPWGVCYLMLSMQTSISAATDNPLTNRPKEPMPEAPRATLHLQALAHAPRRLGRPLFRSITRAS